MKTKRVLALSLIIIIFVALQFISAKMDYSWDKKYLQKKGDNWIIFAKFNNSVSPIFIYSIFNPPVTRIGLIDKTTLRKFTDEIYFVNSLWVDKEIGIGNLIKEEPFSYYIDCQRYLTGNTQNYNTSPPQNLDLNSIEWTSEEIIKKYPEAIETHKLECNVIKSYF